MKFPWNKYEELPLERRNTLQVFITNKCNLNCRGCFARRAMKDSPGDISLEEYKEAFFRFLEKGGKQINILGGEPLLHPELRKILDINRENKIKTTIYTNGYFLKNYSKEDFEGIKLRISLCSQEMQNKEIKKLPIKNNFLDELKNTLSKRKK